MSQPTRILPPLERAASPRGRDLLLLSLLAVSLIGQGARCGWNVIDDALIFCRYAANAAAGYGPVYNPGAPMETHSSPLWVALLTVGGRLGLDLPYFARALGVLAAGALVVLFGRVAARLWSPPAALTVAAIVALDPGLSVWALSGMESSLYALLLFLATVVLAADLDRRSASLDLLAGGAAGLLALTRPEGMMAGAIIVMLRSVIALRRGGGGVATVMRTVAPWLAVMASLTGWRIAALGDPVPATLRAKWPGRFDAVLFGAGQALLFVARRPALWLAALPLFAFARAGAPRPRGPAFLRRPPGLLALAVLPLMVTLLAGGDWMGRDRLPLAALPLLALLAGNALDRLPRRPGGPALLALGALSLGLTTGTADRIPDHGHAARRLGLWLNATLPDSCRIGAAAAGAVPYYAARFAVDPLGISDPSISRESPPASAPWHPGHMHYDLEKFLAAGPDVIVWEFGTGWSLPILAAPSSARPRRAGDYRRELLRDPVFRSRYRPMIGVPEEARRYFTLFRRRD